MRKIINPGLDTIKVKSTRNENQLDCPERTEMLKHHSTARVESFASKKRIVRDRTDLDPPALVSYVFLSGDCYTQEEAWKQAVQHLFP